MFRTSDNSENDLVFYNSQVKLMEIWLERSLISQQTYGILYRLEKILAMEQNVNKDNLKSLLALVQQRLIDKFPEYEHL